MKKLKRMIVLLAHVVTRRVIAVLDFPADIDDLITYARGIHASMTGSPLFAALAAKLATLFTNIDALDDLQTRVNATPPTATTAQRDGALVVVQGNLRGLKIDVQVLADADTVNAETIITAAGMKVKKQGAINKQDFRVKDGTVSGSAKLIAKGVQNVRSAHDWAESQDGTNWTALTPTLAADTLVSGKTPGSIWDFRHRTILKDGPTDWIEVNDWVVR